MTQIILTPPKLALVVATRAALALGVGLLVSPRLSRERRSMVGRSLIALGALTTIPALLVLRSGAREAKART
jgi:hypothetical protein